MGEKNIALGPGKLYINGELFAGINEASIEAETPETYAEDTHCIPLNSPAEFSVCVKLTEETAWGLIRMMREITRYCVQIYRDCPNRRVAHLALHGKKARTRKKNAKRLLKWAKKEAEKDATV